MFRLQPDPVFVAEVPLTVPGADAPALITFNFRHMGRRELAAFRSRIESEGLTDLAVLGEIIDTWRGVEDPEGAPVPYSSAALEQLLDAYAAATNEIWHGYLKALQESRLGN